MIPIRFGPQLCGQLDEGTRREWLVPDGLGGFAMGTASGLRIRRYHGLLVVAGDTPAARHLAVASLDPTVVLASGTRVPLHTHEWADGTLHPCGHELLESFELVDGLPRWRWRIGEVVIERELAMAYGQPSVAVVHRLVAGGPVSLTLDAMVTWRDAHGERRAGGDGLRQEPADGGAVFEEAFRLAGPGWSPAGTWWLGVHHREEAARGLHPDEDLWHAGRFAADLTHPGDVLEVSAWAGPDLGTRPAPATEIVAAARRRARAVVAAARPADAVAATLVHAADAFVITTPSGPDVVAGYPWFGAWSRDTMISYEGLFLATRRVEQGRALLRAYAATLSEGMLANTADTGRTEYNTVDATMWFLHAVERHVTLTRDTDLAAELLPALRGVVDAHLAGTRFGIKVDPADGLITQGAAGEALTWMDARVAGMPITPRIGKPVEVNALWVNGLLGLQRLHKRVRRRARDIAALASTALASFERRYPAPAGWLYDVLDGPDGDDAALRPNQLLAWSLPYAPLRPDAATLRRIEAALLTPLGLRTLAPDDPAYVGRHRGGPAMRDAAYHQGTVWPWLLGPLAAATVRDGGEPGGLLSGIESHLPEFGLGSVSETADGQPPHAATGCPFQAWSVSEVLRARRF
ncbi:MAG TPA: amylo-alpha-1,6-glucosidase [Pilimelia sp.]|nr:amylo-alpha-1,6-glucosidase [Pilimelia sp.]